MRITLFGLAALSFTGCAIDTPAPSESLEQSNVTSPTIPATSGSFIGSYVVPTSADLASAAIFAVPEVDWTISAGTVTLHYEVPVGLVGGTLPVTFTGSLPSGATNAQLTGGNGTSGCTASGTVVSCGEAFANLGTVPISMTVVQQNAAATFNGPVASRVAVAQIFSSDPIGTVSFDVSRPAADGGGGHGGGGGGGSGGGGGGGGRGPH
jgi:hypothetical protein